jgi:hypothetical protein
VDAEAEGAFLDAMAQLFAEDLRRLAGATARRPLARQIALLMGIP